MNNAAKRYTQQGDSLKWLFCKKTLREITLVPTPSMVESLLTFERKPEKTRLEQYFLSGVPHGFLDEYGDPYSDNDLQPIDKPGNYLREVKATLFLKDDRLDSALALFKTLRLQDLKTLRADPFNYRINDFSDSPYKDSSLSYTKLSMVERMVGLYDKLKNDPKNAGLYHFLLGNAYFNMTFLGNVPEAIDNRGRTFKDDYEIYYEARKSIEGLGYFDYKPRNLDWSKALEHYKKGMAAAEEKGDKELAAKCCFMAAKCEQNNYYVNEKPNSIVKGARYHTYFKIMKSNFSETEYYKEAIKECEYFRVYAAWH
jgi:tetratricopeptide (TPR) repeat protein